MPGQLVCLLYHISSLTRNIVDVAPVFENKVLQLSFMGHGTRKQYFPATCIKGPGCCVSPNGYVQRKQCLDYPTPLLLSIPVLYCSVHKKSWPLLSEMERRPDLVANVLLHDFSRVLVTHKFAQYVFDQLPEHNFNFKALQRSIQHLWLGGIQEKIILVSCIGFNAYPLIHMQQARLNGQLKDADVSAEVAESLTSFFDTSSQLLKKIYVHHWVTTGVHQYEAYQTALFRTTGETLRADHTYKVAKSLTAYSEKLKKRVRLLCLTRLFTLFFNTDLPQGLFVQCA